MTPTLKFDMVNRFYKCYSNTIEKFMRKMGMDNFKSALETFLKNELERDELAQQLEQALQQTHNNSEEIKTYLTDLHNANKLSLEDYSKLKNQIEQFDVVTRVPSRPKQTSPSPSMEPTNTFGGTQSSDSSSNHLSWTSSSQWDDSEEVVLKPGMIIRDNYRLEEILGKGGMGEVWKATDMLQEAGDLRNPYVAIKFLNRDFKQHPDALKVLVREFNRYKRLSHPNIVRTYELSRTGSTVFMVMEFLNGISLKKFIRNHSHGVSIEEATSIIKGMANALAYAHNQGIVHLDFKPANIFYEPEQQMTKVIDFGIARAIPIKSEGDNQTPGVVVDGDKTTIIYKNLGGLTETYASCEMLLGLDPDECDDIYALACVTYELLSGKHPFNKQTAVQAERSKLSPNPINGLNRQQNQALLQALAFKREDRTSTVNEFLVKLFAKKKKWPIGLTVSGVVVLLVATIAVVSMLNNNEGNKSQTIPFSEPEKSRQIENSKDNQEGYGQLNIITSPPGFEIYINGEKQQYKTPVAGLQVPAGQVKIRVINTTMGIERNIEITLPPNELKKIGNDNLNL